MSEGKVLAKIAVGEATKDRVGTICIREMIEGHHYEVFVIGGQLPTGDDECTFPTLENAYRYACNVAGYQLESLTGERVRELELKS